MIKYLFILVMSFNISVANENVVKTSELELFLFKVGFESLLKDVSITKDKSSLNTNEIEKINEKIELIMSELYKDKRVLVNTTNEMNTIDPLYSEELNNLKDEIFLLKKEILGLKKLISKKEEKIVVLNPVINKNKIANEFQKEIKVMINTNNSRIRALPSLNSEVIRVMEVNSKLILRKM